MGRPQSNGLDFYSCEIDPYYHAEQGKRFRRECLGAVMGKDGTEIIQQLYSDRHAAKGTVVYTCTLYISRERLTSPSLSSRPPSRSNPRTTWRRAS